MSGIVADNRSTSHDKMHRIACMLATCWSLAGVGTMFTSSSLRVGLGSLRVRFGRWAWPALAWPVPWLLPAAALLSAAQHSTQA